jgi:hypothetical protein
MERFVKAIEEHTKALLLHAEALAKVGLAKVEGAVSPKPRGRPAAGETNGVVDAAPKVDPVAAVTAQPASTVTSTVSTVTAIGASAPGGLLNPKDLALLFVNTAKAKGPSGRDFVTGILKEFNAGTLDKITAEQQPSFVARLNGGPPAGINAVVDDLAGLLG